jgi:hypothetical protein
MQMATTTNAATRKPLNSNTLAAQGQHAIATLSD